MLKKLLNWLGEKLGKLMQIDDDFSGIPVGDDEINRANKINKK